MKVCERRVMGKGSLEVEVKADGCIFVSEEGGSGSASGQDLRARQHLRRALAADYNGPEKIHAVFICAD